MSKESTVIPLTEEWQLRRIPMNVVLERLEPAYDIKTGEYIRDAWKECGYYPTVASAIRAIPDQLVLDTRIQEFDQLLYRIELAAKGLEARLAGA